MGREIRRVPPNWEHPRKTDGSYQPQFDRTFEESADEWKKEFLAWERGERPSYFQPTGKSDPEFWEYHGSPPSDRGYYRSYKSEEAVWFQMYETVSEGTPVTPPFATLQELEDYLVTEGTFWDEGQGWKRENAHAFCQRGWASSLLIMDGKVLTPRDQL